MSLQTKILIHARKDNQQNQEVFLDKMKIMEQSENE